MERKAGTPRPALAMFKDNPRLDKAFRDIYARIPRDIITRDDIKAIVLEVLEQKGLI